MSYSVLADVDTVAVKDYKNEWMFFEGNQNFPLVNMQDFKGNVVHFNISKEDLYGTFLSIEYTKEYSVLVNNILYTTSVGMTNIALESLRTSQNSIHVSIYSENINPYLLNTLIKKAISIDSQSIESEVVVINPRQKTAFHNFYIVSGTLLLIAFTTLFSLYPRTMVEYYRFSRAIAARELDENIIKSRPFTGLNVSMYLFISFLSGQLILSIIQLAELFPEVTLFHPETFMDSLLNWILLSLIVFAGIHLKYVIVAFFAYLFNLKDFLNSHFMNSARLTLMLTSAFSLALAIGYFVFVPYSNDLYLTYYNAFLIALLPIILIIFIKLMAASSFKNLHLFSYLCGTELVPYVVVLSIGID